MHVLLYKVGATTHIFPLNYANSNRKESGFWKKMLFFFQKKSVMSAVVKLKEVLRQN